MPVPKGFTYVPGSISVTGGDATTSGHLAATYCTGPVANACTAQIASGNYKTVYPYIETYLSPGTTDHRRQQRDAAHGDRAVHRQRGRRDGATAGVHRVHPRHLRADRRHAHLRRLPVVCSCASGNNPTYQTPSPLASTTITSAAAHTVTVTGVDPVHRPAGRWHQRHHHRNRPVGGDRGRLRLDPGDHHRRLGHLDHRHRTPGHGHGGRDGHDARRHQRHLVRRPVHLHRGRTAADRHGHQPGDRAGGWRHPA